MRETARGRLGSDASPAVSSDRSRTLDYLPQLALALDVVAMVIVAGAAAALRSWFDFLPPLQVRDTFWTVGPIVLTAWVALIAGLGGYKQRTFGSGVEEYKIILTASLLAAGLTGVACYVAKYDLSRGIYVLSFLLGAIVLTGQRHLLRLAVHRARRGGRLRHEVVIAGTPANIDSIARVLTREAWLGYHVLGAVVPATCTAEETASGTPVIGATDRLFETLVSSGADIVFIAGGAFDDSDQMRELAWQLEHHDIQVVVAPGVTDVARQRVRVRPAGGLPLVHIDPPRHVRATRRAKRTFDAVGSAALLFAVAPVFLTIALVIRLHDRGPVFFRQVRIGRDGEEFACLKFRTMVTDAESRLAQLQEGHEGALWKMKDDPRITAPGRWLRRYSLDELPQLLNVLRGDMSLVGPRPQVAAEVATYDKSARRRLHVRPGMTGLWQVSGRSELSWSEAVRLDLYYVDNWSMLQDLAILFRTFGAVMGSRGAY